VIVVAASCQPLPPDEPAKKPDKPNTAPVKDAARGTSHKVERGPFKIEVTLKGILEAAEMTEIVLRPESWGVDARHPFTVLKAVEHGAEVHKGDQLISLDLEKLDQAIKDLETEQRLNEVAIKLAEEELPVLVKSTPVELAATERAKKIADEDLKKFLEEDRERTQKSIQFSVQSSAHYLEYAKEELRQLEKMYRANDLREETEEIILKRQRHAVESAAHYLKQAEQRRDDTLKVELPRREQSLKETAVKQTLTLDKARSTLPLTLNQKRLSLEKMKLEREKSTDRLHKLQRDRAAMTVQAPADGIVYYGKCQRGQWTTAATVAGKLQRGGQVMPDEDLLTIIKTRPVFVRAVVEEKDLQYVHRGAKAKVIPTSFPDLKLPGTVQSVSAIPVTPGHFEAKIALDAGKEAEALMPGMACTVKVVAYTTKDALSVPAAAVFTDELDDDKHFVYLTGEDGKSEKRAVRVGKKNDGKVEILGGIGEGDEVLLEKPQSGGRKKVTP